MATTSSGEGLANLAYEDSDKLLGIPYSRNGDPNSHSYVDLKRDPVRIDEIPELREHPELRVIIAKLNEPGGCFRSVGCQPLYNGDGEPDGNGQFISYVGFAIDAWPFASKQAAESVVLSFIAFGKRIAWPNTKMIFVVRPTVFYDRKENGWSLEFWACGLGRDRDEARSAWTSTLEHFAAFLDSENSRWRAILDSTPPPGESIS